MVATLFVTSTLAVGATACSGTGDEGTLPPDIPDPAAQQTPAGALARYNGSLAIVPLVVDNLSALTGLLTDELTGMPAPPNISYSPYTEIDSRQNLGLGSQGAARPAFDKNYAELHRVRAQAREARGFLQAYAPASDSALVGHLFAIEAYADLLLAETFCSGIPLSTVDFNGDYTLTAGFSSNEVLSRALGLLDSAATLVGDTAWMQQFVAVERGRILLALGQYTAAAAAVAAVPSDYKYQVTYTTGFTPDGLSSNRILTNFFAAGTAVAAMPIVADSEGGVGLAYRASGDPRVPVTAEDRGALGTAYVPAKYPKDGLITLTLADGVEARLIEAEVALKLHPDDGEWLVRLNMLRTDGTFDTQPTPDETDDPATLDTLWHAGSGDVAGLQPLPDPIGATARLSLVFRERAFWLYLTSHRQGDLRRLIRQYGRATAAVYPSGSYMGGGSTGTYGAEIVPSVPVKEQQLNPRYTGCLNRNA